MPEPVIDQLSACFSAVGARGFLHARDLGTGAELGLDADTPVSAASVIKVAFAIAFAREAEAGRIDPTRRVEVPAPLRMGGSGTAGFRDPALVSLRDLAREMLTVSDNAATDLVLESIGRAAVREVLDELGLRTTEVRHSMSGALEWIVEELGLANGHDIDDQLARADPDAVRALGWLDPARANVTTPREMTTLLEAIWTDRAGPAPACAFVRDLMAGQVSTQRLASGFAPEIGVAAKTGTLPGIRNDVGVVTYPDGRRIAIAVFTRCASLADRNPEVDAAIGRAGERAAREVIASS